MSLRNRRHPGRPRLEQLRSDWKLSIDATCAARVDLLLAEPLTGKPKYGARSKLVQALLEGWLNQLEGKGSFRVPTLQELLIDP